MQETNLGELIFARIHAGPVFALARIQENVLEELFPECFAKLLGEFTRCEYMPRLYSHPREYSKILLVNYLCIGFVPGGIVSTGGSLGPLGTGGQFSGLEVYRSRGKIKNKAEKGKRKEELGKRKTDLQPPQRWL